MVEVVIRLEVIGGFIPVYFVILSSYLPDSPDYYNIFSYSLQDDLFIPSCYIDQLLAVKNADFTYFHLKELHQITRVVG